MNKTQYTFAIYQNEIDNLRIVMYKLRIEMGKGLNSIMRKISKDEINSTDLIFSGVVIYVIN